MDREGHYCWKIFYAFFNNENILIFLHFRIISHNLKLYLYIYNIKKMKEMNTCFLFLNFFCFSFLQMNAINT